MIRRGQSGRFGSYCEAVLVDSARLEDGVLTAEEPHRNNESGCYDPVYNKR